MELTDKGLKDSRAWTEKGYSLPRYDREAVREKSLREPVWLHFGGGNIFRAFQAAVVQELINEGSMDRGVAVVASSDPEVVQHVYREHDNLCLLVTLKADGTAEKSVIGSLMESFAMNFQDKGEKERLTEIFRSPSLQLASFTITEKGYQVKDGTGLLPAVQEDIEAGPENPRSYLGKVASLLLARFRAGAAPLALVSMDNVSRNGDKLREAMLCYAKGWQEKGYVPEDFLSYLSDPAQVSFPWTMIDKITPRPSEGVKQMIDADGIENLQPFVTARGSHAAPYVNAEEVQYLVVEDSFPNGRPPLEKGGIFFADRETVSKCERMKVCCCLNPLHTALAVFGCLLGYEKISEEMQDKDLTALVEGLGYREGMPVVQDPGTAYAALSPREFLKTCLTLRFPNKFLPDTPQRIATDTSQKLAIRYGETVKAYMASSEHDTAELHLIPLVYAAWLRYLLGTDDQGRAFKPSPDPLLEEMQQALSKLPRTRPLTETETEQVLAPILRNASIFGLDLYEAGLAPKVIHAFISLTQGQGAVRRTLQEWLKKSEG